MKVQRKQSAARGPKLPEHQPLVVEIEIPGEDDKPNPQYIDTEYKGQPRKNVSFRMRVVEGPFAGDGTPDNPPGKVWGTHGFTLGKRQNGESSMLRQLLMAAAPEVARGKSGEELENALHDFELDDLRGRRLIVIGRYPEDDDEKTYLKPIAYSAAPPGSGRAEPAAAQASHTNGYQVSPDGQFRWREGMAEWERIPTAAPAPPPPPPAAAAPPPPPPAAPPTPPAAPVSVAPGRADF